MKKATTALTFLVSVITLPLCAITADHQPTPYDLSLTGGVHVVEGWITNIYYNKEFQSDERLQVGGWGDTYRTYVRFDLTGLPKNVTRAVLRLMPFPRGDSSTAVNVNVHLVTSSWTQSMMWGTQPPATLLGSLPAPTPNQWWEIPITAQYNAWQNDPGTNYGLRIDPKGISNNFNVFRSSRCVGSA